MERSYLQRAARVGVILAVFVSLRVASAEPIVFPEKPAERPKLKSVYAGVHSLADFLKPHGNATAKPKALVCVFVTEDCPVALQYVPRLKELHEEFESQGVQFLAIFSNPQANLVTLGRYALDHDIPFPVLLDWEHRLADVLGVEVTPEVVIVDAKMNKRYQGAIDDQFTKRGKTKEATEQFLHTALTSVLAGREVEMKYAAPSGCPIERRPPVAEKRTLTYHRDIAPIIQRNCQDCHREGGVAPFALLTYEDAYYSASRIEEAVLERRMPPWHGELAPNLGHLMNDKRLSDKELQAIVGWVQQGAPEGDAKDAPAPIQWPAASAWQIGKPDFVYKMETPFTVPKSGVLDYQFFRVKINDKKDRWFKAVEVKPGAPEVVHHIGVHLVKASDKKFEGFAGMALLYGLTTEMAVLINDYVPGDTYNAKTYPAGQAVRIPAGFDLIYEVHYTPNGKQAVPDQSMVAFRWADGPPAEEVLTEVFRKPIGRFRIAPHCGHCAMEDTYYFKHDVYVDAIRPHFHLRAKSYRLEAIERDPQTDEIVKRTTILSVPIFDPNWQRTYELERPLKIEAGTELLATGHFDNSWLNPNNPDPNATVFWGQQTSDEMFSTRFKVRMAKPSATTADARAGRTTSNDKTPLSRQP